MNAEQLSGRSDSGSPVPSAAREPGSAPSSQPLIASRGLLALLKGNPIGFAVRSGLVTSVWVVIALTFGFVVGQLLNFPHIVLVFLPPVLFSAVRYGFSAGIWASILSVAFFSYFFSEPRFALELEPANLWALLVFILVAAFASGLAAKIREQTDKVQKQSQITEQLYAFSRKLATTVSADDLLLATVLQIHSMLRLEAVVLVPEKDKLAIKTAWPPDDRLSEDDSTAARWCWDHQKPAGLDFRVWPGATRYFVPLRTGHGVVGVLGVHRADTVLLLTPQESQLLEVLASQAAMTLERVRLAQEMEQAHVLAETERLRTALLTSISHDLKTPLASILGTISSLRHFATKYDAATRDEMLATAQEEAERLSRFVGNLLDMTKLDAGALKPKREMVDWSDVVGTALKRTEKLLVNHVVYTHLASDVPMLPLDFVLAEHVLVNLLDNAGKYTPPGSRIDIWARYGAEGVEIEVGDEGPGIPPADLTRVFDRFFRSAAADHRPAGAGLGLAICKGFVEAMGGRISVRNRSDRSGAVFTITFPAPEQTRETPVAEAAQ